MSLSVLLVFTSYRQGSLYAEVYKCSSVAVAEQHVKRKLLERIGNHVDHLDDFERKYYYVVQRDGCEQLRVKEFVEGDKLRELVHRAMCDGDDTRIWNFQIEELDGIKEAEAYYSDNEETEVDFGEEDDE